MDEMIRKMNEVTDFLGKNHSKWEHTRTRKLPGVLPPIQVLKALEGAVKKTLELWEFYQRVQFSNHFNKRLKKLPQVKMGAGKICYSSMEELRSLERRRGRASP